MIIQSDEAQQHGYAAIEVPESAQGNGLRIFFIVAGTLCGLPTFILSARIFESLGFQKGLCAVILGCVISAALGAASAFTGSTARSGLALLADRAFGSLGSRLVKLIVAVSLVGWFGVDIGVLGATAASAINRLTGWEISPLEFGIPVSIAIAATTVRGAHGLERIGSMLVPITLCVLLLSVYLVSDHLSRVVSTVGVGSMTFGGSVSAVVGSYIVGIVIQPDYGRFVKRPAGAAFGAGLALGVAYPAVMLLSSVASLALGASDLISAMIVLGLGVPALVILMLGAWIDSSSCLYSASLSFANQMPKTKFLTIVMLLWAVGALLVIVGAEAIFVPFLISLSVVLPPLAAVLILSHFFAERFGRRLPSTAAGACWAFGALIGLAASRDLLQVTRLPVLDSVGTAALAFMFFFVCGSSQRRFIPDAIE